MKITIDYICNACGGREVLEQEVDVPDDALEVRAAWWRGWGWGLLVGVLVSGAVFVLAGLVRGG